MNPDHPYRDLWCTGCGYCHRIPIYCGNRFCAACSAHTRQKLYSKLSHVTRELRGDHGQRWRFLTLTVPNAHDPRVQVETLIHTFRKLRQRQWWKRLVTGGIAVIELTKRETGWHAHLHLLALGGFIPQHQLSNQWNSCGGGKIVDIRLVRGTPHISYLCKYISSEACTKEHQQDASDALKGTRLLIPFGAAHSMIAASPPAAFPCPHCGTTAWSVLSTCLAFIDRYGHSP